MKRLSRAAVAVAGAALVVVPATSASAGGGGHGGGHEEDAITTVAGGLDGPRQLSAYRGDRVVVAESDSGEVSSVDLDSGEVRTLLSGLYSPNGVDYRHGLLYVATGEAPPPEEAPPPSPLPPPPADAARSSLVIAEPGGDVLRTVDLLEYELDENPDGQDQFGPDGAPLDALSNPFAVLAQRGRVLVADAGANAVLSVDPRSGDVSTFFVPPVVTDVPACEAAPNNSDDLVGCDPVPTGVVEGPHGLIYVTTLGALAPEAGRVYVLTPDGEVVHVIDGLTAPTGLAVSRRGTVYVSQVLEGAPEGEPGEGFDPATIGEVTRIDRDGSRSTSQVTMPSGLLIEDGELYASAWSVAAFIGLDVGLGEVVRVGSDTFVPAD